MTKLLIRLFIGKETDEMDVSLRAKYGKMAGMVGIICNVLLFAAKFLIGTLSKSVAITADAVNNLSDASSSIVSLLGFKLGSRPADEEHPYGHARYEYLAGLTVSVMILVIGVELLKSSIKKILHPQPTEFSWVFVVVLLLAIAMKLWMMVFNRTIGKKIQSQTLFATAADSRNDVITTSAVLAATLIAYFASINLDGFMGLLVALFILYSGIGIIKDTLDPLVGIGADPELVEVIRKKVMSYPGVLGTHDLMVHDYGPGRKFASVHVEVAAEEDVLHSHELIDTIEREFHKEMDLHLVIHMDPIITKDETVKDMRRWLAENVTRIHPKLTIHDLRIVPGEVHTNLIFDCVVPHELNGKEEETKAQISAMVQEEFPGYFCVISIDYSYSVIHTDEKD